MKGAGVGGSYKNTERGDIIVCMLADILMYILMQQLLSSALAQVTASRPSSHNCNALGLVSL